MRLNDSHLTFGKIADEWARELAEAKVPGRRARDEIFLTFLRGALAGQFDDKGVTLAQARRDVYSEKLEDKGSENVVHRFNVQPLPMPITGEWLAQAQMVPTPRPGVRRPDTGPDPWYLSEGLNLDDFDPLFVSCYIEPLTISKDAFGDWCEQCGHARPAFWFGEQAPAHHEAKILGPQNVPLQSHAKGTRLRSTLQRWLEQTAAKPEAQAFVKEDFLKRAREEINVSITDNLFRDVWKLASIPENFHNPGRPPGRN